MLNNPKVMQYTELAAKRFSQMSEIDDARRMTLLSLAILGREPTETEITVSLAYVNKSENEEQRLQNWARVIQAVFASVDFRYIN